MALRRASVVAAVAVVGVAADECVVSDWSKVDCGFSGITSDQCQQKGCCWSESKTGGVPWCFKKAGSTVSCPLTNAFSAGTAPFSAADVEKIRGYFLANIDIQGSGAVVAAPDHNTGPGGDYYFHWERDGALTMATLMMVTDQYASVKTQAEHYISWVQKTQHATDPHGIDVRAEPKYTIPDGKVFTGGWCRPQNDGPALRARALVAIADKRGSAAELVDMVQYDLDWVTANWESNTCDLWEEVQSNDFFWNRYMFRVSLMLGADFMTKNGKADLAAKYTAAAKTVEATLARHFDEFIFEADNRKLDTAVFAALNAGDLAERSFYSAVATEVVKTQQAHQNYFCNAYALNQADTKAGVPGLLVGRYAGDGYDGGNPWILLTADYAMVLYRQAIAIKSGAAPSGDALTGLQALAGASGKTGKDLADALAGAADGVLMRIKHHVAASDLHMNEQIDRNTGAQTSAKDLTWGYANVLHAMHLRQAYTSSVEARTVVV